MSFSSFAASTPKGSSVQARPDDKDAHPISIHKRLLALCQLNWGMVIQDIIPKPIWPIRKPSSCGSSHPSSWPLRLLSKVHKLSVLTKGCPHLAKSELLRHTISAFEISPEFGFSTSWQTDLAKLEAIINKALESVKDLGLGKCTSGAHSPPSMSPPVMTPSIMSPLLTSRTGISPGTMSDPPVFFPQKCSPLVRPLKTVNNPAAVSRNRHSTPSLSKPELSELDNHRLQILSQEIEMLIQQSNIKIAELTLKAMEVKLEVIKRGFTGVGEGIRE